MNDSQAIKSSCPIFDRGHIMQLDQQACTPSKTVYTCACGESVTEHEDAHP